MQVKTSIAVAGIFILAMLIAAGGIQLLGGLHSNLASVEKSEKINVPVAKMTLDRGTFIRDPETMFESQPILKGNLPPNAITEVTQLRGKVLDRTLDAGRVCTADDLGEMKITSCLPRGHRAMAVRIAEDNDVGFQPGMRVDAISLFPDPKNPERKMSKIFLENLLVLSPSENRKVILAVKPQEAERLAWVADNGPLRLIVRKPGDDERVMTLGATNPFGRHVSQDDLGADGR